MAASAAKPIAKVLSESSRVTGRLSPCCGSVVREDHSTVEFVNQETKRKRKRVKKTFCCNNCERSVI